LPAQLAIMRSSASWTSMEIRQRQLIPIPRLPIPCRQAGQLCDPRGDRVCDGCDVSSTATFSND
jgi:hypothetical protein